MANKKTKGIKKNGTRDYEIDTMVNIDGKRVHVRASGFESAMEAKEAMPSLVQKKIRDMKPSMSDKSFNALVREYIDYRSLGIKASTVGGIEYLFGKHITPYFSCLKVNEALTMDKVRKWYSIKAKDPGESARLKNKVFGEMRSLIERAWHWHYIDSDTYQDLTDLVGNIREENAPKTERAIWTYDDEKKFIASIPDSSSDKPMFTLFCYLGCRLGEFLGLQWKSFDEHNKSITIMQQVYSAKGGAVLTNQLKSDESYRVDDLDDPTFNLIMRYRSTLNSSEPDEYMFPSPYNTREPLSRTEFRRRLYKYIEIAGVPKIVPHGVRHSKATMFASVCQNAEDVACSAKFLGHSKEMMFNTYVHGNSVTQKNLIERLQNNTKSANFGD